MTSGLLVDRYGRLRVVVTLIVAYLLTGLAGGLTTSLYLWLGLRFLMGAASIGMHTVRYTLQVLNTSLHLWLVLRFLMGAASIGRYM